MANKFGGRVIDLDTFTSAIDCNSSMGFATGTPLFVHSIEWQTPTTADHTCAITDDQGTSIFSEKCVTGNLSIIKYYGGKSINNLKIAVASGAHMASGKLIITLV